MKRIDLVSFAPTFLALLIMATAARSDAVDDALSAAAKMEGETRSIDCLNEGKAAELIMMRRQSGESATSVLDDARAVGALDLGATVMAAFSVPRVSTGASITVVAEEFRNRYELACMDRQN